MFYPIPTITLPSFLSLFYHNSAGSIDSHTADRAIKTFNNFTSIIGNYMKQTNVSVVAVDETDIAVQVSRRTNQTVTIITTTRYGMVTIRDDNCTSNHSTGTNVLASASLPASSFPNVNDNLLFAIAYRQPTLFVTADNSILASIVLSVAVNDYSPKHIPSPIELNFKKTNNCKGTTSCVAWSFATEIGGYGHWNSSGCTKVNESNGEVTCQCYHLTNFALLFDLYHTSHDSPFLSILSTQAPI